MRAVAAMRAEAAAMSRTAVHSRSFHSVHASRYSGNAVPTTRHQRANRLRTRRPRLTNRVSSAVSEYVTAVVAIPIACRPGSAVSAAA